MAKQKKKAEQQEDLVKVASELAAVLRRNLGTKPNFENAAAATAAAVTVVTGVQVRISA